MILIFDRIATNKPARRGRFYFAVVPLFVPGVPVLDVCPSDGLKGARGARTYIYYTFVIESLKNQAFYSLCVFSLIFELKSTYFVNYSENFRFFLKIFLFLFGSLK